MSGYILVPAAQHDLAGIRDYHLEVAGNRIARKMLVEFVESFRLLASSPGAGHKRDDLAEDRLILFWPMRDYLVLYRPSTNPLQIITIVRGSQDIPEIIVRREL